MPTARLTEVIALEILRSGKSDPFGMTRRFRLLPRQQVARNVIVSPRTKQNKRGTDAYLTARHILEFFHLRTVSSIFHFAISIVPSVEISRKN
jgi:hypothetical protein